MKKFDLTNWDCKIAQKKKLWFTISLSIMLVGAIIATIFGFNIGIDFSGGSVLSVTVGDFTDDNYYDNYKNAIEKTLADNGIKVQISQKLTSAGTPGIQVRYQNNINGVDVSEEGMFAANNKVKEQVHTEVKALMKAYNPTAADSFVESNLVVELSNVGATASGELILNALFSVLVAAALILVYVAIRFEVLSGLSAVIALAHDILIMTAFMAVFRIQINAPFIAALITIVGYSINNTIVLFDRVRENRAKYIYKDSNPTEIINVSIKDTMTRSINTSITTLFTITVLAIIGVPQIREFALPIIVGLLAGTYSSIFIAPPLWALFKDKSNARIERLGKYNAKSKNVKQK